MFIIMVLCDDEDSRQFFIDLYREYRPLMYSIAMRYVNNSSSAEDLVHDALVKLIEKEENISQFQSVISQQESGVVIGGIADSSKINFILVTFEGVDFESSLVMIEDFLNENLEGTK